MCKKVDKTNNEFLVQPCLTFEFISIQFHLCRAKNNSHWHLTQSHWAPLWFTDIQNTEVFFTWRWLIDHPIDINLLRKTSHHVHQDEAGGGVPLHYVTSGGHSEELNRNQGKWPTTALILKHWWRNEQSDNGARERTLFSGTDSGVR